MARRLAAVLAVVALLACQKPSSPQTETVIFQSDGAASAALAITHPPLARSASAPVVAPDSAAPSVASRIDAYMDIARQLTGAWNDALTAHDASALGPIYAEEVCFYGKLVHKAQLLEQKRRALERDPTFEQSTVGDLHLEGEILRPLTVTFVKRSGPHGRTRDVSARLLLQRYGFDGKWFIVGENDNLDAGATWTRCEAAALQSSENEPKSDTHCQQIAADAVSRHPEVKRALKEAQASVERLSKTDPNISMGGFGPQDVDDEHPEITIESGINTPDRFEPVVGYTVNLKDGSISLWAPPATLPTADVEAIKRACKR